MLEKIIRMFTNNHFVAIFVSVTALIFSLPPFNITPLIFVALIPLYVYLSSTADRRLVPYGMLLFSILFSGYITYNTLSGFRWFEGSALFVNFVYLLGIMIVCFVTVVSFVWAFIIFKLFSYYKNGYTRALIFGSFALFDTFFSVVLAGFNYGSFSHAVSFFPGTLPMLPLVPIGLIIFLVVVINGLLAELLVTKKYNLLFPILCLLFIVLFPSSKLFTPALEIIQTVRVAIIQDGSRDAEVVFGTVTDSNFSFPRLENFMQEAIATNPKIIVYPFSPWVGVMSNSLQDGVFDREVITITDSIFQSWVNNNVPNGITLVTWYSVYRNGQFYNEIGYWQKDKFLGSYQKNKLFPFFDYTPHWAQKIGVYSTPYDGSSSDTIKIVNVEGLNLGSIVCSEVVKTEHTATVSKQSDILFSIGSEAMFTHSIPAQYNFSVSRISAIRNNIPVVRGTKLGPSGIFSANGEIIASSEYGETKIIVGDVPIVANKP